MDLSGLYSYRFSEADRAWKVKVWQVLWSRFFSRLIAPDSVVVDIGAGYCEFINAVVARRKIAVDLNPDTVGAAAPGVETHSGPADQLGFLRDGEVDVVFISNFFEHLPSKAALSGVVAELHRVLRSGGTLIVLGPNVRLLSGVYWDNWDHHLPLSERSLGELLVISGFTLTEVHARFLPYTVKNSRLRWPWLVRAYLALRPWSSMVLGRQFLLVAKKRAPTH